MKQEYATVLKNRRLSDPKNGKDFINTGRVKESLR